MRDDVTLRSVTPDDLDSLFDLHCAAFRAHVEDLWGWDEAWQRTTFKREVRSSDTSVVEVAGKMGGYVQTDTDSHRLRLRNIALLPDVREDGVGTYLVTKLQQQAADRGIPIKLSVFRANPRAVIFYERLGFRETRRTDAFIQMMWQAD